MEKTILIVEDSPETLELLRRVIEKAGYKTILANDGEKGFTYAKRYHPDLIVLDRLLPQMNGLQVCNKVKELQVTQNIPIIMLTVLDSEKDIIDGLKAGADDYIKKPFSPDELLARIVRVMSRYSKTEYTDHDHDHVHERISDYQKWNNDATVKIRNNLNPFVKLMIDKERFITRRFKDHQKLTENYEKDWATISGKILNLENHEKYSEEQEIILRQLKKAKNGLIIFINERKNLKIIMSLIVLAYRLENDIAPESEEKRHSINGLKKEYQKIKNVINEIKNAEKKLRELINEINENYERIVTLIK